LYQQNTRVKWLFELFSGKHCVTFQAKGVVQKVLGKQKSHGSIVENPCEKFFKNMGFHSEYALPDVFPEISWAFCATLPVVLQRIMRYGHNALDILERAGIMASSVSCGCGRWKHRGCV
jgi:hypothetical protein